MLILSPGMRRNRVDIKNLILVGIVPFILLVLSPGPVMDFIVSRIFAGNENIKELLFYLLSRQTLWSVWLGFALGTSVRISFKKSRPRHKIDHAAVQNQAIEEERDEGN